jgi:hypothetical protein
MAKNVSVFSKLIFVFVPVLVSVAFSASAPAYADVDYSVCPNVATIPAGLYDPSLTLKDVMYQFQDHLNVADGITHNGEFSDGVSDADLRLAIDNVASAQNCALLAARNAKFTMKPTPINDLTPDQEAEFLDDFMQAMNGFASRLGHYQQLFADQLAAAPASRDFSALYQCKMDLDAYATAQHSHF